MQYIFHIGDGVRCVAGFEKVFLDTKEHLHEHCDILDHLKQLASKYNAMGLGDFPRPDDGPCMLCYREIADGMEKIRRKVWKDLMGTFEIS